MNSTAKHSNPYPVTAVILAGGKGSRLQGRDKGLLYWQQHRIIDTLLHQVAPHVAEVLINANRNRSIYATYGYPVISDTMADFQGPLAGFASAMTQASYSHILTLPCDGPLITSEYVKRMCRTLPQLSPTKIAVAHDGKQLQPIHALIPVTLLDHLQNFLKSGERKTKLWYTQHEILPIDFTDKPELFTNINTPAQLATLQNPGKGKHYA